MRAIVGAVSAVALVIACSAATPPTGEGTEYPCGYHTRLCQISNLCCLDGTDCPGSYACPMKASDGQPHCCGHVELPSPNEPPSMRSW